MNTTLTITGKGQTTIPAALRRKFGVDKGGVLQIRYDEKTNEAIISRPLTIDELSARVSSYIKPGIKPLTDVDAYYQRHREVHL